MRKLNFRLTLFAALALLAAVLVAACSPQPGGIVDPTSTIPPTEAPSATPGSEPKPVEGTPGTEPAPGGVITGTAQVETIDLFILESFPVQIHASVTGYLGDGCTTLGEITQTREDDTFYVTITTTRPADAICTQQLVGFEETIPLDVAGLPAGTYTVDINGVTETFTLDVDNVLS
jgi:inhibitor of cysteine peptidase